MKRIRQRNRLATVMLTALLFVLALPAVTFAQGRGRGWERERGRKWDKCGKFVNCHDARDGRRDRAARYRRDGTWRNGTFVSRGDRVGYRNRYNTNDYWRRRHLTYRRNVNSNLRYRRWRNQY